MESLFQIPPQRIASRQGWIEVETSPNGFCSGGSELSAHWWRMSKIVKKLADTSRFRVLMLGEASGIKKTDAAIEDLFPEDFYLECVNKAYRVAIAMEDLPVDGSSMITKRVEEVLQKRFGKKLDKGLLLIELLKRFDTWKDAQRASQRDCRSSRSPVQGHQ